MSYSPEAGGAARRKWMWRILRFSVSALAIGWVLSRVDLDRVVATLSRLPALAFAGAIALTAVNLAVGAVRWAILLRAYGAPRSPAFERLLRLYYIGFFYNTCLPGGVGGDVVRGVASREAFGEDGTTGAIAVVFVERVLGVVGLLLVVAISAMANPTEVPGDVLFYAVIGIGVGAVSITALALGSKLARFMPIASLRRIAERLPRIMSAPHFMVGIALSLVTQSIVALGGHVVASALHPGLGIATSFVVVPIAMATQFLPFTVGGAGAREEVFRQMYGASGMSSETAVAASIAIFLSYLAVALVSALIPMPAAAEIKAAPPSQSETLKP